MSFGVLIEFHLCVVFTIFFSILNDTDRGTWVYVMGERTEVSKLVRRFITMVKNQFSKGVKVVRSDNEVEFTLGPMQEFYLEHEILYESRCVYSSQQNERVECKHHHILKVASALKFQVNLPI